MSKMEQSSWTYVAKCWRQKVQEFGVPPTVKVYFCWTQLIWSSQSCIRCERCMWCRVTLQRLLRHWLQVTSHICIISLHIHSSTPPSTFKHIELLWQSDTVSIYRPSKEESPIAFTAVIMYEPDSWSTCWIVLFLLFLEIPYFTDLIESFTLR